MDNLQRIYLEINKTLLLWGQTFAANLPNMVVAIVLIAFFYVAQVYFSKWFTNFLNRTHLHASLKILMVMFAKIFIMIFGIFFALGIVGLDKTVVSLMAGVGVIGLALGFAFKDLAANLISGLFVAVQNPFDIGDTIMIKGIQGTVENIRLRDTILNVGNGQRVYIPNKSFMEDPLYNFSQTAEKRLDLTIGVSYEDDLQQVIDGLTEDLKDFAGMKAGKGPTILIKEFTPAAVMIQIYLWIDVPGVDGNAFSNRALIAIKNSIQKHGFHIPVIPPQPRMQQVAH